MLSQGVLFFNSLFLFRRWTDARMQYVSKHSPWTSSIRITWGCDRNANPLVPPQILSTELEIGVRPKLCLNKLSIGFKFENHCFRGMIKLSIPETLLGQGKWWILHNWSIVLLSLLEHHDTYGSFYSRFCFWKQKEETSVWTEILQKVETNENNVYYMYGSLVKSIKNLFPENWCKMFILSHQLMCFFDIIMMSLKSPIFPFLT